MRNKEVAMEKVKRVALVAHDSKKADLIEWAKFNRGLLAQHEVFATGTTGRLLEKEIGVSVTKLQSGPLGGDQQLGALIVEGFVDFLVFFWDPLAANAHDSDVRALERIAAVWNIPMATNRASADFMISSLLMDEPYSRLVPDYDGYRRRRIPKPDETPPPLPSRRAA
ncbi:MAG TPA: methylglyoxal synthase [Polyangia bacterium]|nr:methylglyoxal synthase [Polyangia bacterium]